MAITCCIFQIINYITDINFTDGFDFFFFLQGRFYLKNRQKPTATLIYTDNIIYNIYTTYIPPPPIINTFSDVKIHVSKVHVHQNSKRRKQFNLC